MFHKVVRKVLLLSVAATLVVTPVMVNAAGAGHTSSGTGHSKSSSSSSEESESVTELVAPDGMASLVPGSNTSTVIKSFGAITKAPWANAVVTVADSTYGPAAAASLEAAKAALGVQTGPVLDIVLGSYVDGKLQPVSDNTTLVGFKLTVPADYVLQPGCEFAVIHVSVGGAVEVLPNWTADPGALQFYTTGSGVFALTQVPAGSLDSVKIAQYNQANAQ